MKLEGQGESKYEQILFSTIAIIIYRTETILKSLPKVTLEKEMATHANILAWRIPRTEEPGGLESTGSQKSQTRLK